MLACASLRAEMQELCAWATLPHTPSQVSDFIDDLADWLSFCSLHKGAHQQPAHFCSLTRAKADGEPHKGCSSSSSPSLRRLLLNELGRPEMPQLMGKVGMRAVRADCGAVGGEGLILAAA